MLEIDTFSRLKMILRKMAGILLYFSGIFFLLDAIFKRPGIYILNYHRLVDKKDTNSGIISRISADYRNFEKQIEYFSSKYKLISMSEALEYLHKNLKLDKECLVITFDDGYKDNFIYGLDIFRKYGLKPVIYVTAKNIEEQKPLWPDIIRRQVYSSIKRNAGIVMEDFEFNGKISSVFQRKKLASALIRECKKLDEAKKHEKIKYLSEIFGTEPEKDSRLMMTWEEVRELDRAGAEIGSHTLNHPILSNLSKSEIRSELFGSKVLIEKNLGKAAEHFAYPNGKIKDMNPYALKMAGRYYKSGATTIEGVNYPGRDEHKLKRVVILYDMSLIDIKIKLLYYKIADSLNNKV